MTHAEHVDPPKSDSPPDVESDSPPEPSSRRSVKVVASRTRRVQFADRTYDLVEGEPVDVDPAHLAEWVDRGWVHQA